MYARFKYTPLMFSQKDSDIQKYRKIGNKICEKQKSEFQKNLKVFIEQDVINGTALQKECFPILKNKSIFISHSHNDIDAVTAFAGWLFECFGLEAFVDAWAWDYSDDLLKEIDDEYCYQPRKQTYNYKKRNLTTSHVHMMLVVALAEMMDKAECVIFFNTPNSVSFEEEIGKIQGADNGEKTFSPWIYYELSLTTKLRIKEPKIRKPLRETRSQEEFIAFMSHDISQPLKEMKELTDKHLNMWYQEWTEKSNEQKRSSFNSEKRQVCIEKFRKEFGNENWCEKVILKLKEEDWWKSHLCEEDWCAFHLWKSHPCEESWFESSIRSLKEEELRICRSHMERCFKEVIKRIKEEGLSDYCFCEKDCFKNVIIKRLKEEYWRAYYHLCEEDGVESSIKRLKEDELRDCHLYMERCFEDVIKRVKEEELCDYYFCEKDCFNKVIKRFTRKLLSRYHLCMKAWWENTIESLKGEDCLELNEDALCEKIIVKLKEKFEEEWKKIRDQYCLSLLYDIVERRTQYEH